MDADERSWTGSEPGNEHAGSDLRPSVFIGGLLFRACAMKLEYQSRWLRVLIELFPAVPAIRHYPNCDGQARWINESLSAEPDPSPASRSRAERDMSDSMPNGAIAPLPPPRVPDHELLRRIGRGAYGEVWLARSVTAPFAR